MAKILLSLSPALGCCQSGKDAGLPQHHKAVQLGLSPPFWVTHKLEPLQTFKPHLGCMKALHTSFGREVLLRVSFPPCTPSPLPTLLLFLFTSSQGTRSLRTLIFPVSQYLLNWPLLFSRAFPSLPAQSPSPPGVSMATGEGRKQLMASCNCAGLRERKRRAGKQELAQQNPLAPRPRIAFPARAAWLGNSGV